MSDLLTSIEVCNLAGCTYRQLDYWTRQNRVPCEVPAEGSGSTRLYDPAVLPLVWAGAYLNTYNQATGGGGGAWVNYPRLMELIAEDPLVGMWNIRIDQHLTVLLEAPAVLVQIARDGRDPRRDAVGQGEEGAPNPPPGSGAPPL